MHPGPCERARAFVVAHPIGVCERFRTPTYHATRSCAFRASRWRSLSAGVQVRTLSNASERPSNLGAAKMIECAFTGCLDRDAEMRHVKCGLLRMLASSAAVEGAQAANDAQVGDPPT
jgi:hypothetical protein